MPDAIMFFAAGFGTRMRHLTKDRPKPLVPVAGRTLLEHALAEAEAFGPLRRVVNAHYHSGQVEAFCRDCGIPVSTEADEILDTGGGLKTALPMLEAETVFTMNTDAVWRGPNALSLLAEAWQPDQMDALMLCVPGGQAIGHHGPGNLTLAEDGRLSWGQGHVFTGLQIIKTDLVADWPGRVFSLKDIWLELEPKGRLHGVAYPGAWCDVGSPEGVKLAEEMLRKDV